MNRRFAVVLVVASGVFMGGAVFAQTRLHDEIMRDIQGAYRSLGQNIEASETAAAVENAARLESLFEEVEAFWARLDTDDAVGFASAAAAAAADVAARVGEQDMEGAKARYDAIRGSCGGCHTAHRVETQTGFVIKP